MLYLAPFAISLMQGLLFVIKRNKQKARLREVAAQCNFRYSPKVHLGILKVPQSLVCLGGAGVHTFTDLLHGMRSDVEMFLFQEKYESTLRELLFHDRTHTHIHTVCVVRTPRLSMPHLLVGGRSCPARFRPPSGLIPLEVKGDVGGVPFLFFGESQERCAPYITEDVRVWLGRSLRERGVVEAFGDTLLVVLDGEYPETIEDVARSLEIVFELLRCWMTPAAS